MSNTQKPKRNWFRWVLGIALLLLLATLSWQIAAWVASFAVVLYLDHRFYQFSDRYFRTVLIVVVLVCIVVGLVLAILFPAVH